MSGPMYGHGRSVASDGEHSDVARRRRAMQEVSGQIDLERRVFTDETSTKTNMATLRSGENVDRKISSQLHRN